MVFRKVLIINMLNSFYTSMEFFNRALVGNIRVYLSIGGV